MSTLVKIIEALLYVFGALGLLMGVATIALATSVTATDSRSLGTLAVLYTGLPAFGFGAVSLGLGALVTSVEALRRDTILVAATKK